MQDVLTVPDWNTLLASTDGITSSVTSGFVDGTPSRPVTMPDGRTINLASATNMINCGKSTACSDADMDASTMERPWGKNNPRFRLYAWGPVNDLIPTGTLNSPFYVAVWIADDAAENDDNPSKDGDPSPSGNPEWPAPASSRCAPRPSARWARITSSRRRSRAPTEREIERGYTGQRGQDEQNRRARKAAVQTPGAGLSAFRDVASAARWRSSRSRTTSWSEATRRHRLRLPPAALAAPAVFALADCWLVVGVAPSRRSPARPAAVPEADAATLTTNTYRAHVVIARGHVAADAVRRRRQLLRPERLRGRQPVGQLARRQRRGHRSSAGCTRASSGPRAARRSINRRRSRSSATASQRPPYTPSTRRPGSAWPRPASLQVIAENTKSARFGLLDMRQANPRVAVARSTTARCRTTIPASRFRPTGAGRDCGSVTRAVVDANNGSASAGTPLVKADGSSPNTDIATILNRALTASGALLPAGNDPRRVD